MLLEGKLHLPLPGDVLERLDGCDDLPLLVVDRGRQKIQVSPLPPQVLVEVARLEGPLDDRRLGDSISVILFKPLDVDVHDEVGDDGALLSVKRQVLPIRPDHLRRLETRQLLAGAVPQDDAVVPVDDKHRDGRPLDDPLDGASQLDILFEFRLETLCMLLEGKLHLPLPGDVLERLDGCDDLPLLVVDRGRQKIQVPPLPPQVLVEVARLEGPLDNRRLLNLLLAVILLQAPDIPVHDEVGDDGALLRIEGPVLPVRPDHLRRLETRQLLAGAVPQDDAVVPVDDKHRDGRTLQDALNREHRVFEHFSLRAPGFFPAHESSSSSPLFRLILLSSIAQIT